MRVLIQWAKRKAEGWLEVDSATLPSVPSKPDPASADRLDNRPGWINAVNVQGVVIDGYDHYNFQWGTDEVVGEWVCVTAWTVADATVPEAGEKACAWTFLRLSPDPDTGGAWNTRQLRQTFGEGRDQPWSAFVPPAEGVTLHGKLMTDAEFIEHKASQSIHSWREWIEGIPAEQIENGRLKPQRSQGLYKVPDGTRTYWLTNTLIAQPVVATENELEATDTQPSGSTGTDVSESIKKNSDEMAFSWTANGTSVIDTAWVSGSYRFIMDVSSAGADITYALDGTIRGGYEGFNQYDNTNTTVQETKNDDGSAQSGTGIKTFTTGSVSWTDDTATDNKMVVALGVANGHAKDAQTLSVSVNDTDSYIDGPWAADATTGTVAPATMTFAEIEPAGTVTQVESATIAPKAMTLTEVDATPTYAQVESGTVVPEATALSVVSPTAAEVTTGTTAPVTASFASVDVTPTWVSEFTALYYPEPLTYTFGADCYAVPHQVETASVVPDGMRWWCDIGFVEPDWISYWAPDVDPVTASFAAVDPTASASAGTTGNTDPVAATLTPVNPTAGVAEVVGATVAPLAATLTPVNPTAGYTQLETASVVPDGMSTTVVAATASVSEGTTGTTSAVATTLTPVNPTAGFYLAAAVAPSVTSLDAVNPTAGVAEVVAAIAEPLATSLTIVNPTAGIAEVVAATVAPSVTSLDAVNPTASASVGTVATVAPLATSLTPVNPTAGVITELTANTAPEPLSWAIGSLSAGVSVSGSVSPVGLLVAVTEPTAGVSSGTAGSVVPVGLTYSAVDPTVGFHLAPSTDPVATSLTVVNPTAGITEVVAATVAPASMLTTIVNTTASIGQTEAATVDSVTASFTTTTADGTFHLSGTAVAEGMVLTPVLPFATTHESGSVAPVGLSWTVVPQSAEISGQWVIPIVETIILEGPSMRAFVMPGISQEPQVIEGPRRKAERLTGANTQRNLEDLE